MPRWLRALLCSALTILAATARADDPARHWRDAEAAAHGDFTRLLALAQTAPLRPQLRHWRPLAEHVRVLEATGRFQTLGITREQGVALVRAWYARQGLDERGALASRGAVAAGPVPSTQPLPPTGWRAGREFDPLQAVLLRWPFDWSALRDEYAVMIRHIVDSGAEARIWVDSERQRRAAERTLRNAGVPLQRVRWIVENTDSVWLRDYGPNFIYGEGNWGVVDFHYYSGRPADDDTPLVVAGAESKLVVDRQVNDLVHTEGGNINTDGLGAVLFSKRTYKRNPGVAPATIDERIGSALNAPQRLVLQDPVLDSTGHVDMFSKIVDAETVLVAQYDPDEVDHQRLEDNAALLAAATNGAGKPWKVVRIRQPDVYYEGAVSPVIRTYTNSIIVNDRVIVPVYGIADDAAALAVYASVFPGKTIVPLNANDIIGAGGAWHCVTMEFPRP